MVTAHIKSVIASKTVQSLWGDNSVELEGVAEGGKLAFDPLSKKRAEEEGDAFPTAGSTPAQQKRPTPKAEAPRSSGDLTLTQGMRTLIGTWKESAENEAVQDLVELTSLNFNAVIEALKTRHGTAACMYTRVGRRGILLSVNPFQFVDPQDDGSGVKMTDGFYSVDRIKAYYAAAA